MAKFTVISTSGYQGDGWNYRGEYDNRKQAMEQAAEIQRSDARCDGYITAIIGKTEICYDHYPVCLIGDTSRVATSEARLKSRKCHISYMDAVQ